MSSSITGTTLNRHQLHRLTNRILDTNSLHFMLMCLVVLPFSISISFFAVPLYISSSNTHQTTLNNQYLHPLTNRILNANSLHFITISLLFIPLTINISTSATSQFYISYYLTEFDPFNQFLIKTIIPSSQNLLTLKTLITILAFACFVILPTVAGIALITFSTNQAMQRKPLTFSSTLKSLSRSYVPLLYTVTAGAITVTIVFLAFTLSSIMFNKGVEALDFHFGVLLFSTFVNLIISYALPITILFYIVVWGSAAAITVLESKSGFVALKQSANQSTEFRHHSFLIVVVTRFGIGLALMFSVLPRFPAANWIMFVKIGAIYLQLLLTILHYVVANTVLYVQYKVGSGEEVRLVENDKDGEVNGGFNYMLYLLGIFWAILLCAMLYDIFITWF